MPFPLEVLWRPLFKGPATVDARSTADRYAGRTVLSSGSATVTVSTTAVTSDSLIMAFMEGNANVASGTNRVTEVKTIADGAYFVLGTQDGQPIPRDTTIMWAIWRTK